MSGEKQKPQPETKMPTLEVKSQSPEDKLIYGDIKKMSQEQLVSRRALLLAKTRELALMGGGGVSNLNDPWVKAAKKATENPAADTLVEPLASVSAHATVSKKKKENKPRS